ncbi:MAG: HDOD domain-containing protein [Planctomycetes bacterium]|nr:HDOD domain-containing protein [Planctomycetota bacterium]
MPSRAEAIAKTIRERVRDVTVLPTLPVVVERLREALAGSESNAAQVAEIIRGDPPLMARVLRLAGSSFYTPAGAPLGAKNLSLAIVRLGFDTLREIGVTTGVIRAFHHMHFGAFRREEFWRHSILTAVCAESLAVYSDGLTAVLPSELYVAGLLHDIGMIFLDQFFNDEFTAVMLLSRSSQTAAPAVERAWLGIDHAEVGALMVEQWGMSPLITHAVRRHHDDLWEPDGRAPAEARDTAARVVNVANRIARLPEYGFGRKGGTVVLSRSLLAGIGVPIERAGRVRDRIDDEVRQSEVFALVDVN